MRRSAGSWPALAPYTEIGDALLGGKIDKEVGVALASAVDHCHHEVRLGTTRKGVCITGPERAGAAIEHVERAVLPLGSLRLHMGQGVGLAGDLSLLPAASARRTFPWGARVGAYQLPLTVRLTGHGVPPVPGRQVRPPLGRPQQSVVAVARLAAGQEQVTCPLLQKAVEGLAKRS